MTSLLVQPPARTPQSTRETVETKYEYTGIPTTCDGAEAVVHVEINVAQAAGAYPITSSTTMGGGFNAAAFDFTGKIPLGRLGRAEDMAGMALALLSDRFSGYVTGTTVAVDGGIALYNWIPLPPG